MPDYLRMDLGELVRHLRGKAPRYRPEKAETLWLLESHSQEARLRVVPGGKRVEFVSLITGKTLFALPCAITGPPVKSTETADRGQKQVVLSLPLEGGKTARVTFQSPPDVEPTDLMLTRASQARVPPDSSMVEFLLTREEHEFRYVFEFPGSLEVLDFQPVADQRPVFRTIPPVAQMAAFLRAMTQHRRSPLTCLEDIARKAGSESTRQEVRALAERFPRNHAFASERIRALEKVLQRGGRIIQPVVLAAMTLFVDFEQGRRTAAELDPAGLEISPAACWHVARHFQVEPSPALWRELFGEAPDYPEDPELREALRQSASSRTHLDILGDLGREARSPRVAAFVDAMRPRLDKGQFQVNDEQVALGGLLSASGTPVHGNTLTALCLFVDVEVGVLTPPEEGNPRVATSMYAMVAVAGAFDLGLRGFALESISLTGLESLLSLAGGRLMARFGPRGEWEFLATPADAARLHRPESGHVLGKFALIDQLNERDLGVFLQAGHPLLGCFSADYDRTMLWKKLDPTETHESYTFIRGYTAFSFNRMVMAELSPRRPEKPSVVGELDQRGNYQFRFLEDPGSLPAQWEGRTVHYPSVEELPELMYELGQDPLLGRSETLMAEARTLELIHASVGHVLKHKPTYVPLDEQADLLARLCQVASGPVLAGLTTASLDPTTRDGLLELIQRPDYADLDVYQPLAQAVDTPEELEFLALQLLFALCCAEEVELERRFKQFDETRLRQLLRTRLHGLLDSPSPHTRALAVKLLVTREEVRDRNDHLMAHYELSRRLQDEDLAVRQAAGESLAQLALEGLVPLPEMFRVQRRSQAPRQEIPAEPEGEDQDVLAMTTEIHEWLKEKAELPESDRRRDLARAVPEGAIATLAEFLVGLNRAVPDQQHTYVLLLRAERLRPMRSAVFDSWKVFALSRGVRLCELVRGESPAELKLEYQDFVAEHGAELATRFVGEAPFLGGPLGPVTLYHLNPHERFGTWRRKDSSFVEARREDSPLFLALLGRLEEMPRVLRVERAGGLPLVELESHLASFVTERIIEPWQAEVYQPRRRRFAPFLHSVGLSREHLDHEEDLEDYEALLGLLQEVPEERATPDPEQPAPESASGPTFRELVTSISQAFEVPRPHQKQVVNILLDVGIQSVYDL